MEGGEEGDAAGEGRGGEEEEVAEVLLVGRDEKNRGLGGV